MWSIIKKLRRHRPAEPSKAPTDSRAAVRLWLEREEASLLAAIDSLALLMADPVLGGPGFLTVQFPQRADEPVTVSCQYPNITETLYQAALRGAPADFLNAGVPPDLLTRGLRWETESGTVVILTLNAAPAEEEIAALLTQLHSRNEVIQAFASHLSHHYNNFTVRPLAGYILLTPKP